MATHETIEIILKFVEFTLIWAITIYLYTRFRKTRMVEVKLFLAAFLILSIKAVYKSTVDIRKFFFAIKPPEPFHPVIDHFLDTFFFILIAYAVLRPIFLKYRKALDALLYNNIVWLLGATVFIFYDYSSSWEEGVKFGVHWGDFAFESFQFVLILVIVAAVAYVWRGSRSQTGLLVGAAFSLWAVSHVFHIYNIAATQNIGKGFGYLFKGTEILAIALLALSLIKSNARKGSFMESLEEDAAAVLQKEIDELTFLKNKLEEEHKRVIKSEAEMKRLKEFNEEIVEHAPVGIIRLDAELKIDYENPKMKEILGVPEGEDSRALGRDIRKLPSVVRAGLSGTFNDLTKGEEVSGEAPFSSIYNKESILSFVGVPLFEDEKFSGSLILVVDITKRKKAEEKLHKKIEELERWQRLTVDREVKMLELKKKIKELEGEIERVRGAQ